MLNFSIENQGANTYLVYNIAHGASVDMTSIRMLANNRIPGLAQAVYAQMDDQRYIKYNISGKIATDQLFLSPIRKKRVVSVFSGIVNALLSAEEYMLDADTILLDLKYMYSDISSNETVLICLPVEADVPAEGRVRDYIKQIMYNTEFDQSEDCGYVATIINFLNSSSSFSLGGFRALLDSLSAESVPKLEEKREPQPPAGPPPLEPQGQQQYFPAASETAPAQMEPMRVPSFQAPTGQQPAIPYPQEGASRPVPVPENESGGEDSISLVYLLRHYSKENAELYRAQQDQKKRGESGRKSTRKAKENASDARKAEKTLSRMSKKNAPKIQSGFVVPGTEEDWLRNEVIGDGDIRAAESVGSERRAPVPQVPDSRQMAFSGIPAAMPANHEAHPEATIPQQNSLDGFGETDFFQDGDGDDETAFLGMERFSSQAIAPHLIRKRNNERIPINSPVFRLGRDMDFNNYAIVDNRFVGHSHCHIQIQNGEYFLVDDNSKNHTKVNGTTIQPSQPVKLMHGYAISVADEEFEFKLY